MTNTEQQEDPETTKQHNDTKEDATEQAFWDIAITTTTTTKETKDQNETDFEKVTYKKNKKEQPKSTTSPKSPKIKCQHRTKHTAKPRSSQQMYNQITRVGDVILIGHKDVEEKMDHQLYNNMIAAMLLHKYKETTKVNNLPEQFKESMVEMNCSTPTHLVKTYTGLFNYYLKKIEN